jgi:hypothetical protein
MIKGINLIKIYCEHLCKYLNVSLCTILYDDTEFFFLFKKDD